MEAIFRLKIGDAITGDFPTLVGREAELPRVPEGKAHAVIGMRRAGKTCFLNQHLRKRLEEGIDRDRLVYFNYEDERLAGLEARDMGLVLEEYYRLRPEYRHRERVTFCLDEVQTVPGWESFLRRMLDEEKVEVLFSGSSARLLSREIATQMRGRSMETVITPYSFREFLTATGREPVAGDQPVGARRRSELENAFGEYMETGGFPEAVGMPLRERVRLLQSYVDAVLFRDMVERHGIANLPALRALVRQLLRNPATQASINKTYNDFKSRGVGASKETLLEFFAQLEDCFLVQMLAVDTRSERRRQTNPKKVYLADHSLAVAFQPRPFADRGHHLENVVACELLRSARDAAYVKSPGGYEVDFVARDFEGEETLIQVSLDLTAPETRARELRALADAAEDYPGANLLLLTEFEEGSETVNGNKVRVLPTWRWLSGLA